MQKIPLSLAQPGMVLAKPVENDAGITVIGAGAELTDTILSRLENMGIERIMVEGNPVDMGGDGVSTAFDDRIKRMDHLFRRQNSAGMQRVKQFFVNYFKMKAAQQAALIAAAKAAEEEAKAAEEAENAENGENGENGED